MSQFIESITFREIVAHGMVTRRIKKKRGALLAWFYTQMHYHPKDALGKLREYTRNGNDIRP